MTDANQISIPTSLKILCATQKIIRAIFRKPKLNKKEKKYTSMNLYSIICSVRSTQN